MLLIYVYTFILFHILKILLIYLQFNFYLVLTVYSYNIVLIFSSIYTWFLVLMFLVLISILYYSSKKIYSRIKFSLIFFFYYLLYYIISLLFLVDDCIFFIIAFESMLFVIMGLSMFFIFNNRFIIAIYYLIIFSIISGICCFLFMMILFININITGLLLSVNSILFNNISILIILWLLIYIIFGVKYPIYPFYFWLLAVHVEVSSEMSTLLAGIILKSGFIGMFKFLVLFLSQTSFLLSNISTIFVLIGLVLCSFNLLIITDYKKIIGSWSILHVNITLLFLWYYNHLFILVFILSNLGHVISSSSFFLSIGFSYENFSNKHLFMISSAFNFNIYNIILVLLILNNIDFPFFLLFYIELLNFFAIIFISNYLLILLIFVILVLFVSSLLIYFISNYYQSKWLNLYMRLDTNIADFNIFFMFIIYSIILFWYMSSF